MKKIILILLATNLLTACGFEIVDTGHRGIKVRFGEVTGESLTEGLYFYNPITSDIKELDVRTQKFEDKTATYSNDAQMVDVYYTINFNLEPSQAHIVYKEVGRDWAEKLMKQVIEGTLKEVTGKYKAVDIIADREKVTNEIREDLKARLKDRRVLMTAFEINNLDFDDSFEQAVKDKVIAVERAKEAKNKTVQVEEQARQTVISAKANAEAMKIKTQALAKSKALVEYEAVKKWDGKMPQYMMGGSVPFINLGGKK